MARHRRTGDSDGMDPNEQTPNPHAVLSKGYPPLGAAPLDFLSRRTHVICAPPSSPLLACRCFLPPRWPRRSLSGRLPRRSSPLPRRRPEPCRYITGEAAKTSTVPKNREVHTRGEASEHQLPHEQAFLNFFGLPSRTLPLLLSPFATLSHTLPHLTDPPSLSGDLARPCLRPLAVGRLGRPRRPHF